MKTTILLLTALLLAAALGACARSPKLVTSQTAPVSGNNAVSAEQAADIGEDAAKAAAFDHAKVKEADATVTKCEPDYDDSRMVYEIEFYTAEAEYDYEIDAATGKVRKHDRDKLRAAAAAAESADIGEDAAKTAAFDHAKVKEADATVTKCQLDIDDGRRTYEIEFYTAEAEYDYEIDAATGKVREHDRDKLRSSAGAETADIGEDAAKAAAFAHAKVAETDASMVRCRLEIDDGRRVYEVEFVAGKHEYEYKIDAATGKVLEHDRD